MKGAKKIAVTLDALLDKVNDYYIYQHYIGSFKVNESFKNPFYADTNAGFRIFLNDTNGKLYHYDWGDESWKGDVVDLVKRIYNINYHEALLMIDRDMKLGVFSAEPLNVEKKIYEPVEIAEKKETIIQAIPRDFSPTELKYWEDYYITRNDLRATIGGDVEIHAFKSLYINKSLSPLTELTFGYLFQQKYWKIYKPHEEKKNKWLSNTPLTQMYGISNIPKGTETSFILKSVKDWMVVRTHIIKECAGTQNESERAISPENINYLLENCENNYICFDNDATGVQSCSYYNSFGLKYWNVPNSYYNESKIKDPSDLVKAYGPDRLYEEITKKIQL